MSPQSFIMLIISALAIGYLFYALLHPEKF
jgi:K+-transporting ATPase KdpF subunit